MRNEKGFTLIEVMIALALLGVIVIAFLGALATASNAIIVTDKQTTAESLARTEIEYVKKQDYSIAPWSYELPLPGGWPAENLPDWWDPAHALPPGYDDYTISVNATPLPSHGIDDGIQMITITIRHLDDNDVITLEGYKTS